MTVKAGAPAHFLGPLMIDVAGVSLEESERELLRDPGVGGVVLFARNYRSISQVTALIAEIHGLREPPLVVAVDHEGGRVQRFVDGFTVLPPASVLGAVYDQDPRRGIELSAAVGTVAGSELAGVGIDINFAPVVDIAGANASVIGDRAFHSASSTVAILAARQLAEMRKWGICGVVKHFPGHGGVDGDTHLEGVTDGRDFAAVRDSDLAVYETLIAKGLGGVMTAHVAYSQIAPEPATFSPRWLMKELRARLRFRGLVFSDDLVMTAARTLGGLSARVDAALAAGCDVVLACNAPAEVEALLRAGAINPRWYDSGLRRLAGHGVRAARARALAQASTLTAARRVIARYAEPAGRA